MILLSLPSALTPSEVKLKWRFDYINANLLLLNDFLIWSFATVIQSTTLLSATVEMSVVEEELRSVLITRFQITPFCQIPQALLLQ